MKRHLLLATAAVGVLLTGCDKIPFIGGGSETATDSAAAPAQQATPVAADSAQTPAPASMDRSSP